MKFYSIEKIPKEEDDKSVYGFMELIDHEALKKATTKSRENKIPNFQISKVEIHPSKKCNLNCNFCINKKINKSNRNLPEKEISKLLKDLKIKNPEILIILSGLYSEPLTHPKIEKIIKSIGKNKFRFGLYTNGLLLNKKIISAMLKAAKKSKNIKPSYISFNISASLQTKRFDQLIKKIETINKKRNFEENFEINTPILLTKQILEYNKLKRIIKALINAGADNIRLSFPWEKHNQIKKSELKEYEKHAKLINKIKKEFPQIRLRKNKKKYSYKKCFVMARSLSISPEGDIYPCPEVCTSLLKEKLSYGNIKNRSITKIWRSKKHQEIFKNFNSKKQKCLCCPFDNEFNRICNKYLNSKN